MPWLVVVLLWHVFWSLLLPVQDLYGLLQGGNKSAGVIVLLSTPAC
jgi:hypothetical protein